MSHDSATEQVSSVTLGEALTEYINSLKPEVRIAHAAYVRKYVEHAGEQTYVASLTSSRIESYAEAQIKVSDPSAGLRVAALKQWFQFLKKRSYTSQNYGVHIRVRKLPGRGSSESSRTVIDEENSIEMTREGHEALTAELNALKAHVPELVSAVAHAREDKDFRENAPLEAAREALAFNEQRIKAIEAALKRAAIVQEASVTDDRSSVGSVVTVTRLDTGKQETYRLVGAREANPAEKKISVESPVGKVLLGRRAGDDVSVSVPSGVIQYRIDAISRA